MEQRYQTIARALQQEIESGRFAEGELLPTRTALATRFDVARATLDRAVSCLIRKGVLEARRGSGTAVATRTPVRTLAFLGQDVGVDVRSLVPAGVRLERIRYDEITSRSERSALRRFDGLIWNLPEDREIQWARETPAGQPQLVVNRHLDGFNYVSVDHRGAIRGITERRLAECRDGLPVFLSATGANGLVWRMREEGFVDACRSADRFYEIVQLPAEFDGRVATLRARFPDPASRPLVLVSGSRANTGAVVAWVTAGGLKWRRDIYYSDFDNEYPAEVWGLTITSFIQDFKTLSAESIARTLDLIEGRTREVRELIPPRFVAGDT